MDEERNLADAVTAFRIGADDYIVRSTEMLGITLHIEAMIRRYIMLCDSESKRGRNMIFNNLKIDEINRTAWKNNKELELMKTEFELLHFMARHKGQILSREQLCEGLWSNEYIVDDKSIITHIHRLRMKIEDNPSDPQYILTVRGNGYRFNDN